MNVKPMFAILVLFTVVLSAKRGNIANVSLASYRSPTT